jgi:hypothetical protein
MGITAYNRGSRVNLPGLQVDLTTEVRGNVVSYDGSAWTNTAKAYYETRDYDTWAAAIASIGSTMATLVVAETIAVSASVAIPTTMTLAFSNGAYLAIATGVTLTINGTLDAPLRKIFDCAGTGKVAFGAGAVKEVYPEWWGAKGDNATDDTAAIAAALIAWKNVYFGKGIFLTDKVVLDGAVQNAQIIRGVSPDDTIIKGNTGEDIVLQIGKSGAWFTDWRISDMSIDMANLADTAAQFGIYELSAYGGEVRNVKVINWGSTNYCLGILHSYTTEYSHCDFGANGSKVYLIGASGGDWVTTIHFSDCDMDIVVADYASQCSFTNNVLQGSGSTHFQLDHAREVMIAFNDVEGTSAYMTCTADTGAVNSLSNSFDGSSGQYLPTTMPSRHVFMDCNKTVEINPEESTWTPSPTNLAIVGTPSYVGKYTKIGKNVWAWMQVYSDTSTASTAASTYFTGLPYNPTFVTVCSAVTGGCLSLGNGYVYSDGKIYTPTWAAVNLVWVSFFYTIV